MSHRIDVELTSQRDDGTWTWRAAGALQPKGVLDGALLPDGAAAGDVLRAEVETGLDGTEVLAVLAPKQRARREPERIELLGSSDDAGGVTTSLVSGRSRDDDRPGGRRRRPDGRGDDRRNHRRDDRRDGRRDGRSDERGLGPGAGRRGPDQRRSRERPERPPPPSRPRPKRLRPQRAHRRALLDQLPAEQRPLAELVMRGGVPLVRETLEAQRVAATEAGHPPVQPGPVLDVAEKLNVHVRLAEWQDRAAAALDQAGEVDLRDLRSVVVAADGLARHEATREVADQLRVALGERVEAEHAAWLTELTELLDDGRTVRALRVSSHPPKAGSPLPPPLAARLAAAAAGELTAETSPSRYAAVVEVLALSPVRTQVTPAGVPATTPDELVATVRRFGDRLPQVAAAFGVEPLPPSRSRRPRKPAGPGGPPRPASPATPGT